MDINVNLLQWSIYFVIKKTSVRTEKKKIIFNEELAEELQKPFIQKFVKRKVHSVFLEDMWVEDLEICN